MFCAAFHPRHLIQTTMKNQWVRLNQGAMNAMLLWVSVIFVSFYISTQNIHAKKQFKERFHSNGTVSFLYNNRPRPNVYVLTLYVPRIPHQFALDWRSSTLIRWKWSPETRHFEHTLHGGNLRKFQEVQRFCVWKATFLEYNNDSKFGLDTFNES